MVVAAGNGRLLGNTLENAGKDRFQARDDSTLS